MSLIVVDTFEGQTIEVPLNYSSDARQATARSSVVRGTRHRHLFDMRAGQRASVHVHVPEQNAEFEILDPQGERIARVEGQAADWHWTGDLFTGGRYLIDVYARRGNAPYVLTLSLAARELADQLHPREVQGP